MWGGHVRHSVVCDASSSMEVPFGCAASSSTTHQHQLPRHTHTHTHTNDAHLHLVHRQISSANTACFTCSTLCGVPQRMQRALSKLPWAATMADAGRPACVSVRECVLRVWAWGADEGQHAHAHQQATHLHPPCPCTLASRFTARARTQTLTTHTHGHTRPQPNAPPPPPPEHLSLQAVDVLCEAAQQQALVMQQAHEAVRGRGRVVACTWVCVFGVARVEHPPRGLRVVCVTVRRREVLPAPAPPPPTVVRAPETDARGPAGAASATRRAVRAAGVRHSHPGTAPWPACGRALGFCGKSRLKTRPRARAGRTAQAGCTAQCLCVTRVTCDSRV